MSAASPRASTGLITPTTRLGVTAGYTTGTQWVGGFDGVGRTDTFQTGLYGGYSQDKVYADAVIGYAYGWNQMWRNIPIPGLGQRTAQGRTGANQFFGQAETGYRFDLGTNANAFVTPFARLQAYTGTQNAFTETGAQSLNLTVAQQTTNSLRSVIGAQLGGAMDLGWREKLAMQFRLGWAHEYADTGRPVTGDLGRRAGHGVHHLRRGAAARRRAGRLQRQHRDRRGDVALPALRGHHLGPGQRARPHGRRAHDVVSGADLSSRHCCVSRRVLVKRREGGGTTCVRVHRANDRQPFPCHQGGALVFFKNW